MNIAMMQQLAPKVEVPKQTVPAGKNEQLSQEKFGSVFNKILATTNQPATQQNAPAATDLNAVGELISADSLEEVLEILGIPHDAALLFIEVEGDAIAVEDMMNLEDLAAALSMEKEELVTLIEQLLGEEMPIEDIWTLFEQAPNLLAQIMSALQGEHQVPPQQAEKVIAVLKLAEVIATKTDTVYTQEVQLIQVKEAFQQVATQLQQTVQVQQQAPKAAVLQQVPVNKQETDATQPAPITSQQSSAAVKTVTVTLPAERPAQSEALIKEIQNLINRSQLSSTQGTMKLMLKLYPENLGSIRIEIMQKDGMLTARLLATTTAGKELLDSNLQQLKAGLAAQNIQVERLDVSQALQDAERNMRDQSFFNNFFKQQNQEQEAQKDEENDDKKSFSEFLNEEV
ncbi:flagellar hook-length control protein FliK [Metasolibacillus sp.]|uniref:flagellar hook-length control protein FliK n=1 Tax=Metasolibacillus sp. TaxID=2703680 RepID=UPI0025E324D8|nr:flagellar hook-length control protein FliK [Metasolibacillus sp.]MCT6923549.1 flagellar hook-length control protein FliK [Metasolibacillus sp.]MCT6939728.1 flagellar hook-length control protein FliK [Metasolibacillus sp.]